MLRGILVALTQFLLVPWLALFAWVGETLLPGREITALSGIAWGRAAAFVGNVKFLISGHEQWWGTRPAVVVANHTSAFDILAVMALAPSPYRFVAKKELFKIPVLGQAMRAAGHVPLERSGSARDIRALASLQKALGVKALFMFFPEGSRTEDGRLSSFKGGAFHFAIQNKLPVIPVAICGAHHVQPYPSIKVRPGVIELKVLAPIDPHGLDRATLTQRAYDAIAAALPHDQRPLSVAAVVE
ncbi:MAG: lysophospholipid acyltransferase family protein [Acidobacteriota bacterium]